MSDKLGRNFDREISVKENWTIETNFDEWIRLIHQNEKETQDGHELVERKVRSVDLDTQSLMNNQDSLLDLRLRSMTDVRSKSEK